MRENMACTLDVQQRPSAKRVTCAAGHGAVHRKTASSMTRRRKPVVGGVMQLMASIMLVVVVVTAPGVFQNKSQHRTQRLRTRTTRARSGFAERHVYDLDVGGNGHLRLRGLCYACCTSIGWGLRRVAKSVQTTRLCNAHNIWKN